MQCLYTRFLLKTVRLDPSRVSIPQTGTTQKMNLADINILVSAHHILVSSSVIDRTDIGYTQKNMPKCHFSCLLAKPDTDCVTISVLLANIADQIYWYWLAKHCLRENISTIISKNQVSPTLVKVDVNFWQASARIGVQNSILSKIKLLHLFSLKIIFFQIKKNILGQ